MSERCPGCRRTVEAGDARCQRCGAGLLGVELEGTDDVFGTDIVVGGRSTRTTPRPPLPALVGAAVAVAAVVLGIAAVGGGGSGPTATATTTSVAANGDPSKGTTTTASLDTSMTPVTTADESGTTSTTIDRREIRSEAEGWSATVVRKPGLGTMVVDTAVGGRAERTGLTMAVVNDGNGATVQFTDLDTGDTVSVAIGVLSSSGGGFTVPQLFAGGAVVQLQTGDPVRFVSLLVRPDGDIRSLDGLGALVDTFGSSSPPVLGGSTAWFFDRTDGHLLHLVDLASAVTVRSLTIPPITAAVGVDDDDPVVVNPAGQRFAVAADGTARPAPLPDGNVPQLRAGARRVSLDCDVDLAACTQAYVDEAGKRTPLLGADRALTTSALPAPAGLPLVALVPVTPCPDGCRFSGPPPPSDGGRLRVIDAATGDGLLDIASPARVIGSPVGGPFGSQSGVTWSTDGRWLFYPVGTHRQLGAWRPGLVDALTLTLDRDVGGDGSFGPVPLFFPTPPVPSAPIAPAP